MSIEVTTYISAEEYLARERQADTKSEWIDGEIREMTGASREHRMIVWAIAGMFWDLFKGKSFEAYPNDLRVRIPDGPYYYPDVTVAALPPQFEAGERPDTLLNPLVIFEVLSESTEQIDRGEKLDQYRRILSLTDYLLVDQERPRVDHYHRSGDHWALTITTDLAASVSLPGIGCELPLGEIYARVFPPGERGT
jgi:Uma2 family endonuclease